MNKRTLILIALLLVLAILAAGCANKTTATPATTRPTSTQAPPFTTPTIPPGTLQPLVGAWNLIGMTVQNGTVPFRPTTQITIQFNNDNSFSGNGGCNNYYGTYTFTGTVTPFGSGMAMSPITSTKMYCQSTSSQEDTYLQVLQDTNSGVVNGNQLVLTGVTQNTLVYQQNVPTPVQSAAVPQNL
jgi:heat shock protein HslJ